MLLCHLECKFLTCTLFFVLLFCSVIDCNYGGKSLLIALIEGKWFLLIFCIASLEFPLNLPRLSQSDSRSALATTICSRSASIWFSWTFSQWTVCPLSLKFWVTIGLLNHFVRTSRCCVSLSSISVFDVLNMKTFLLCSHICILPGIPIWMRVQRLGCCKSCSELFPSIFVFLLLQSTIVRPLSMAFQVPIYRLHDFIRMLCGSFDFLLSCSPTAQGAPYFRILILLIQFVRLIQSSVGLAL